jgi:hypothetical protein
MTLSWRRPESWRKLRTIDLRLVHDGVAVGEITLRARTGRISGGGAIEPIRKVSRLTHHGKMVTARLALRLDERLAGETLERKAGSIRVAG